MKSRRRNLSEDRLITSRRDERSKNSVNGTEVNSESIPIDLVMEILSRLPAKSIAKCRCVSKLWSSLLRRTDFTELFLTRSRSRPQILFACGKHRELFFYSSPQLQIHDENSSSTIIPSYLMRIPLIHEYGRVSHINGLVFLREEFFSGRNIVKVSVLCNPSTGKSLVLSKTEKEGSNLSFSYLGYDPIEKQFKVLSINSASFPEFQVMTLGTRNMSWRKIECCILHYPSLEALCVNGVLYYPTVSSGVIIACFDFRSEKFSFVNFFGDNITAPGHHGSTLINYNGKLGSLVSEGYHISGRSTSFVLWVLEDAEKQEWSKHVYVLPPLWESVVGDIRLKFVGLICANQFVFSSSYSHSPSFCLFYYNAERNTIRKVEILGMEVSRTHNNVYTFLNHVEDIKPIDGCC